MPDPAMSADRSRLNQLHLLPGRVLLALAAVFCTSLLTLALSEYTVPVAAGGGTRITTHLERQAAADRYLRLLSDAETAQRGFLLTGDKTYLTPYQAAVRDLQPTTRDLRRRVVPGSATSKRLDRIDVLTTQRLGIIAATITMADKGQVASAIDVLRQGAGKQLMNDIRAEMRTLQNDNARELAVLQSSRDSAANRSRLAVFLSTALTVLLLIVVARLAVDEAIAEKNMLTRAKADAEAMQETIRSRTADLAALSSHLQVVSENEKADLARNLHDEMGGLLTAARMDLAWLQGASAGKDPAWLEKVQQLSQILGEAMDVKRRVVESLRPALLDHFGLPTALQNHFDETCKKAGLHCTTTIPEAMDNLPEDVAIALFRVGQESLTNIVRHAKASNVHLEIVESRAGLSLEIRDDGVGMELGTPGSYRSYGLAGMRHRIEGLGGRFDMDSQPGKGTRVHIRIPAGRS